MGNKRRAQDSGFRVQGLIAAVILLALPLAGCKFALTNIGNDQLMLMPIKSAALELGIFTGKTKTEQDDLVIRAAYEQLRLGQLSPDTMATALEVLAKDDERIAAHCINALEALGVVIQPGVVTGLDKVSPEAWDAARNSYLRGYAIGIRQRKA